MTTIEKHLRTGDSLIMANNDFYGGQRPPANDYPPAPYYNQPYTPSPQSTPAPSYSSYAAPGASATPGAGHQRTGPSPFDTVFDDNAYPMNSRNPTPAASTGDLSQQNAYYDASYQGQGGYAPGAPRPYPEDIPLQDRPKDPEMNSDAPNDHVYDATQTRRKKGRKVRVGELGMFGADKKRIPWVVYIFTVAQVAVFIGQMIRAGKLF